MKRYSVAVAALALKVEPKWIDNILSHFSLRGVEQSIQGRSRRLDERAVLHLGVVLRLWRDVGIPLGKAIPLAASLVDDGRVRVGELQIAMDTATFSLTLAERLADAVEMAVAPARGRPPLRARRAARPG